MGKLLKTNSKGITLIALVITIIVLLILAAISIATLTGENGILTKASRAKANTEEAAAKEKLLLTLTNAGIEKKTNVEYNKDEWLDKYILNDLEGSKIKGDIVIVDNWAFELDRDIPAIKSGLGKASNLKFPELDVTITKNNDNVTINILTSDNKNGIKAIEILLDGDVVKKYEYENEKGEISVSYTTDKNGSYIIKAISNLTSTEIREVSGIISPIEYTPNGSKVYQKSYNVKIETTEEKEKIKSIKYVWKDSAEEPNEEEFIETVNNGETITKDKITGKMYLWTLIETVNGTKRTGKSDVFYFDNQGPQITGLSITPISINSFRFSCYVEDECRNNISYAIYLDNYPSMCSGVTSAHIGNIFSNVQTGTTHGYILAYDELSNMTRLDFTGETQYYTWQKWNATTKKKWGKVRFPEKDRTMGVDSNSIYMAAQSEEPTECDDSRELGISY